MEHLVRDLNDVGAATDDRLIRFLRLPASPPEYAVIFPLTLAIHTAYQFPESIDSKTVGQCLLVAMRFNEYCARHHVRGNAAQPEEESGLG